MRILIRGLHSFPSGKLSSLLSNVQFENILSQFWLRREILSNLVRPEESPEIHITPSEQPHGQCTYR
jgi:hypothetical protein